MQNVALSLNYSLAPIYSFAFQQNQYPLITSLTLSADNNDHLPQEIEVQLTSDPEVIISDPWKLTHLENGTSSVLNAKGVRISPEYLNGLTEDLAVTLTFEIFVEGCSPIQVSYLGYPGTLGSNCIDYIIADKII